MRASRVLLFALVACGTKTGLPVPIAEDDAEIDAPDALVVDARPDTPDAFDAGPECIPFRTRAELASLDIYILLDSSGSMEQPTAAGSTKAEAINRALAGFLRAPESSGLGVGLSFFPFEDTSVPEFCTGDAQCGGTPGTCFEPDVCSGGTALCRDESMCPAGEECLPLGRCAGRRDLEFCFPVGDLCDGGDRCVDAGICENRTSCDPDDYARPEVPVDLLPGVATRIVRALEARELGGSTPTLPALTGILEQARERGIRSPGSKVIVLLATDGFPAACDEALPDPFDPDPDPAAGIVAPSAVAAAGVLDGIQTFVVGVFAPEDEAAARGNLSQLAMAGGTEEALIITTDDAVSERLLQALNELRAEVRTCVYAIPAAGAVPDPRDLEVRLIPRGGDTMELARVRDGSDCDPRDGGFYFQQDIELGARPGYVELCPSSCALAAREDVTVEMQAGCRD